MAREYTLYWTSLELYETCPQKYLWSRGWGTIDVGGGPGRPKPLPLKDSEHHRAMGKALSKVVEDFYNLELWRNHVGLRERMMERAEREISLEIARSYIDYRVSPSKSEMVQICREGAARFLTTVSYDKLLGEYARAEVNLIGKIDANTPIGGRADIVIRRSPTDVIILDGKNSQSKGKYTDPDQLRWYALCYRLVHGQLPHRLGFVYFRFPADPDAGTSGVDWVTFTEADVDRLAERAIVCSTGMREERFHPTPSPKNCKFCDFETVCSARQDQKNMRSRKPKGDTDTPTGFFELGFDGGTEGNTSG